MTETLTESFCERCGTRYEFQAPTRLNPLRKTRGFIGGLKNWVTSQDDMSDAMRDAMRQQEEALAAAQLDAFHESFNFCIDCRQYTCLNCWNDAAGRCRSCAPIPGTDDLAERLAASMAGEGAVAVMEPVLAEDDLERHLGSDAWPTSDLPFEPAGGHPPDVAWPDADAVAAQLEPEPVVAEEPEPEPVVAEEPERVVAEEPEPEPVVAEEPEPEPVVAEEPEPVVAEEPEPVVAEEPEPVVAEEPEPEPVVAEEPEPEPVVADTRPPLRVVAWDEDAAYEVTVPEPMVAEHWEPELVAEEPEPVVSEKPEPVVAEEPEPEPVVSEEPEPVIAEEPEPVVAEEPEWVVAEEPEAERVVAEELEPEVAEEPEWVVAEEPEPVVAEEPEPVVSEEPVAAAKEASAEIEPEPAPAPRPRIGPISETILRFPDREPQREQPQRQAAEDDSPEVAARRAQLDLLGLGDPGEGPVEPTGQGVLPYRSRGATPTPAELAARAGRSGGGFWEASAREVAGAAATIGVQNCGQCGLSLSANARFCRRCGTRQARSA